MNLLDKSEKNLYTFPITIAGMNEYRFFLQKFPIDINRRIIFFIIGKFLEKKIYILSKEQDLKEFDSKYILLHKVVAFDIPILDMDVLLLLLWDGCDPNQHGEHCTFMDLVNSSYNHIDL